jgi:hypothetical protein
MVTVSVNVMYNTKEYRASFFKSPAIFSPAGAAGIS